MALEGEQGVHYPRHRGELWELASRLQPGDGLRLEVARGTTRLEVRVPVVGASLAGSAAANWPLLLVAAAFLAFGLLVLVCSHHPIAVPIFAVSASSAIVLGSVIEPALPWTPEAVALRELWSRAALLALAMVPASLLHLAMRFPVVARRFRTPALAVLPYLLWLGPATFGQARFHEAQAVHSFDWLCAGAALLAAAVLLVANRVHRHGMSPIERYRARAMTCGFVAAMAAMATVVVLRMSGGAGGGHLAALALLAFPISIGWAVVRYQLLDPPAWLPRLLLFAMTGSLAIALVVGGLLAGVGAYGGWGRWRLDESITLAILIIASYQAIHLVLHRAARRRVLPPAESEILATRAIERLHDARSREAVLGEVATLIREGLGASQVATGAPGEVERAASPLLRRGVALWRRADSPIHRLALAGARSEDPGPERPEIVVPLQPPSAPLTLLVVASRADGLSYAPEHIQVVETVAHVATTALGSVASTTELERLVSEKTRSLRRALDDRARVLDAALTICEADAPEEVVAATHAFASGSAERVSWDGAPDPEASGQRLVTGRLGTGRGAHRIRGLVPDADRAREVQPQLDTVCLFGTLALARLELLRELKSEVERQAREIAETRSRRVHAEFVRNVAHELRKPTEEVAILCDHLEPGALPDPQRLVRLRAVSNELARRLDLLLFHSGIRLERRRLELGSLIDEAVRRFGAVSPDRAYRVRHATRPLPVVGDASRLLSVLENLIDNAVKATGPGGRVAVRSWLERPDGRGQDQGVACFEVEDDGAGIPADRQPRVFEPGVCFRDGGFGLGLALCREIVGRHGGALAVESEPGCTVFRVQLPQFATGLRQGEKL